MAFNRVDKGSNLDIFEHSVNADVKKSLFPLSYLHTMTASIGRIIPHYLQETVPGDKLTLSNDIFIRALPMTVSPLSRMKCYTRYFYLRFNNMWHLWDPFVTRGRSGNYETSVPKINPKKALQNGSTGVCGPGSLWNYLGFPILSDEQVLAMPDTSFPVAFPFYAYLRCCRDFYMDSNLRENIENKSLFPDNDYDFVLKGDFVDSIKTDETPEDEDGVSLLDLIYADFERDYFVSAMYNPQRGVAPSLAVEVTTSENIPVTVNLDDNLGVSFSPITTTSVASNSLPNASGNKFYVEQYDYGNGPKTTAGYTATVTGGVTGTGDASLSGTSFSTNIRADKLRELFALQVWQERNNRSSGDYNDMVKAHFGINPRIENGRPYYIGGTVQDVVFSEILSTAQTVNNGVTTPVGEAVGKGLSSANGYVGEFMAPDYGLVIGLMHIVPDVHYSDGYPREWTRDTYADYYFPEFNDLGPQGILNKELFVSDDVDVNDDLFGYQERFAEMKHRMNRVSGLIADKTNNSFSSYTWNRFFNDTPTLSKSFVNMKDNVRSNMFVSPDEPNFIVQVANICRAVRPLPYRSIPGGLV